MEFYKGATLNIKFETAVPEGGTRNTISGYDIRVEAQRYQAAVIPVDDYSFRAEFSGITTEKFTTGIVDIVLYLTSNGKTAVGKATGLVAVDPLVKGTVVPGITDPVIVPVEISQQEFNFNTTLNSVFAYEDLTEEQKQDIISGIQTEADGLFEQLSLAIATASQTTDSASDAADSANSAAALAVQKAGSANDAATAANNAATGANQAAGNAEDAAALANQKAALANEAALATALSKEQADAAEALRQQQEDARKSAETARNVASNMYNVTLAVPPAVGQFYAPTTARAAVPEGVRKRGLLITYETSAGIWNTEKFKGAATSTWSNAADWEIIYSQKNMEDVELTSAEALNVLYNRIVALENFIATMVINVMQVDTINVVKSFNLFGDSNMVLVRAVAPAVIPDFIGQRYVNTAAKTKYTAAGISSVADWIQD